MKPHSDAPQEAPSEDILMQDRREKRAQWIAKGLQVYPTAEGAKPKNRAKDLQSEFGGLSKEELEAQNQAGKIPHVSVAGRILLHQIGRAHV